MHAPVTFVASHAELGGQEGYLLQVLRALPPGAVAGLVALEDGPAVPRLAAAAPRTWVVPTGARAGMLVGAARLRRLLLAQRAELVHADGIKAALCASLALAGTGVPVVWMKHDGSLDGPVARAVASRCRAVVGVSATVLEALHGVSTELHVVPNGIPEYAVDRAAAVNALRAELGAGAADPVVVQVGRIVDNKGQLETVAAAAAVLRERPAARFAFVGEPDRHAPAYAADVRERAAALGGAVTFLGYRDDAVTLIAGADVLVAPSLSQPGFYGWREGFGLAIAEAMAVGTPVVAYEDPALVDTLAGCGAVVPAGDRAALAQAILTLLGDDERRRALADCGRRRARDFSLPAAIEGLRAVYRSASRARTGPGSARL